MKFMQDSLSMQLLSLPCESIESELRSFTLEWKMEEAIEIRGKMQIYNPESSSPAQPCAISPF